MGTGNIRGSTLWSVCLSDHYVLWTKFYGSTFSMPQKIPQGGTGCQFENKDEWRFITKEQVGVGWGRWRMTKRKYQGQGPWFNCSISILAEGSPWRSISPGGWQSGRHVIRNWEWSDILSVDSGWTDLVGFLQNAGNTKTDRRNRLRSSWEKGSEETKWTLVGKIILLVSYTIPYDWQAIIKFSQTLTYNILTLTPAFPGKKLQHELPCSPLNAPKSQSSELS